jgi:hypothetical protein
VVTLWVGGLWIVGYVVVPALFAELPAQRMLAGALAGSVFSRMAWVGLACAVYLLVNELARHRASLLRSRAFWVVVAMSLLNLAGHFGLQPVLSDLKAQAHPLEIMLSPLRDQFALWHGVSSVLYLVQSLLGVGLVMLRPWSPR